MNSPYNDNIHNGYNEPISNGYDSSREYLRAGNQHQSTSLPTIRNKHRKVSTLKKYNVHYKHIISHVICKDVGRCIRSKVTIYNYLLQFNEVDIRMYQSEKVIFSEAEGRGDYHFWVSLYQSKLMSITVLLYLTLCLTFYVKSLLSPLPLTVLKCV